jgi:hypothetical protein
LLRVSFTLRIRFNAAILGGTSVREIAKDVGRGRALCGGGLEVRKHRSRQRTAVSPLVTEEVGLWGGRLNGLLRGCGRRSGRGLVLFSNLSEESGRSRGWLRHLGRLRVHFLAGGSLSLVLIQERRLLRSRGVGLVPVHSASLTIRGWSSVVGGIVNGLALLDARGFGWGWLRFLLSLEVRETMLATPPLENVLGGLDILELVQAVSQQNDASALLKFLCKIHDIELPGLLGKYLVSGVFQTSEVENTEELASLLVVKFGRA